MSIKKVKPTSKSKYKQGYYKLINESKYIGGGPIIYRSSWERKFCHWCDHNTDVIHWISEPFAIKYFNVLDKKYHNYYPDFYVKIKSHKIIEYIVEIKPKAQLQKPKPPKRKTKKALKNFNYAYETYVRNLCKVNALNEMASKRNFKVMLLTEESNLF
tara:strand:- start:20532 stop:21005 length:474 start_codon:yes stop_codon:yes gene_type:complete